MTDLFQTSPFRTPSAAEERAELQSDHAGAQRDAALERVRVALIAAQQVVCAVHRTQGINLIDAVQAMETALADVEFERERP